MIKIIIILSILIVLIYISSIINILFIAKGRKKIENRKKLIRSNYEQKLTEILFNPKNLTQSTIRSELITNEIEFKDWSKVFLTKLIFEIISKKMDLNINNYKETLKALDLPSYWEEQLRNKNIKDESIALRILDDMSEEASSNAISNKTISQNKNLRKHAKSIFMKFDSNDAFKFLEDDFDEDFNPLDAIRIHDSLKDKSKSKSLPPLIRYAHSAKNKFYIAFLIKEIGFFKQIDSVDTLIDMFQEPKTEDVVKAQIAETLGVLKYEPAIPILIDGYDFGSTETQSSILFSLGELGGEKSIEFLSKLYYETHNKEIIIKILQNLHLIDKNKTTFNKLKSSASTDFEKSIFDYIDKGHSVRK
ncbi:HEAT repeat domain-containing protein [Brumimicrobium aurantiacum]|uniref:HEAT repeat domain-containing protein n=1 Tax=Brumimicrobium aurantiacum TaxID=1737063 RepID=UPI000F50B15D|nr:HEAT repeat domain-containing protein [Brumimicrobium aurantiacum]